MNSNLQVKADRSYYDRQRQWPARFELRAGTKVLDIGCGRGALGEFLKDRIKANVVGIEIVEENYHLAKDRIDQAMLGDFEKMDVSDLKGSFDYIVFSDSLEHMIDSDLVIRKAKELLTPDGQILMAMPNVRNFRVTLPLLFNDEWRYTDEGLLDRTHMRFFTCKSITRLLHEHGLEVMNLQYDLPSKSKVGLLNLLTFGLFKNILTSHFFIQACQKRS